MPCAPCFDNNFSTLCDMFHKLVFGIKLWNENNMKVCHVTSIPIEIDPLSQTSTKLKSTITMTKPQQSPAQKSNKRRNTAKPRTKKPRASSPSTRNVQNEALTHADDLSRAAIISRYHQKQKQLSALERGGGSFPNAATREMHMQLLRAQLRVLGLERYQAASLEGERQGGGFDSSAWVLEELRVRADARDSALRLLDVGAIVARFPDKVDKVALDVTAIDLNPRDDDGTVIRADFFEYAKERDAEFDVVCLCLCVNFVGCSRRRGEMLRLAALIATRDALLFLTLPRACVDNSRYFDEDALAEVLGAAGWERVSLKFSARLVLVICKRGEQTGGDVPVIRKRVVRKGEAHNNFAIELGAVGEKGEGKPVVAKTSGKGAFKQRGFNGVKKTTTSNQRKRARRKAKGKKCDDASDV